MEAMSTHSVEAADRKLPLGVQADGTLTNKATPVAFILGTVAVFALLPVGVLGIVLNNMGLERVQSDPEKARKLVAWSWGILAVTNALALTALAVVLIVSL